MRRWWQLPEGWLTPILVLALVITAGGALQGAAWHPALQRALIILTPAALGGLLLGFFLALVRRIPSLLAHLVGLLAGTAVVVQLSGTLRAVAVPFGQTVAFLDPALLTWKDLATELLIRAIFLGRALVRGTAGQDVVLFVILMAGASWLIGFLSIWFAIRSHWPAMAVGFPGLVLLLNVFYAPRVPPGYFGFYLFLSLIFLVYYFWRQREVEWQRRQVRYSQELRQGILWAGVLFSLILVLGTSLLPITVTEAQDLAFWERFIRPWREVRETWERLFSNVRGDYDPTGRLGEFRPRFVLSGARSAPEGIALVVRSARNDYLRALVFDQYTGQGWNSPAQLGPVWVMGAAERLPVPVAGRTAVLQEITPYLQGGNLILSYAEPVSASLPTMVEVSAELGPDYSPDIVAVRTRSSLVEGQPYTVLSYVSTIDKASLRQSGQTYSAIIAHRYLQLPAALPQRVYELADLIVAERLTSTLPLPAAGEITLPPGSAGGAAVTVRVEGGQIVAVSPPGGLVRAGLVTPYDAAEAIEEYLRTRYRYRDDIVAPPLNRDVVDYFLFESQAGYCDYFASAMAVLLRTQGVPTRIAQGYAAGNYDQALAAYVVPARLAHSWVEVYFPTYGWQRFEPTAAEYTARPRRAEAPPPRPTPDRDRPLPDDEEVEEELGGTRPPPDVELPPLLPMLPPEAPPARQLPWATLGIAGGIVALGALIVGILALRVNRGLRSLSPAAALYERMCRWAEMIRLTPPDAPTPYEISSYLGSRLTSRRTEITAITAAYVRERFGNRQLDRPEITGAHQSWKEVRWALWSFPGQQLWAGVRKIWARLPAFVRNLFREPVTS